MSETWPAFRLSDHQRAQSAHRQAKRLRASVRRFVKRQLEEPSREDYLDILEQTAREVMRYVEDERRRQI